MGEKFKKYLGNFRLIDLLGFATLLKVEERDSFEDFQNDIIAAFNKVERKRRKEFLKLAKDISQANLDILKQKSRR